VRLRPADASLAYGGVSDCKIGRGRAIVISRVPTSCQKTDILPAFSHLSYGTTGFILTSRDAMFSRPH
jgi:hypothetical protein